MHRFDQLRAQDHLTRAEGAVIQIKQQLKCSCCAGSITPDLLNKLEHATIILDSSWSSIPGLLHVWIAALQGVLLVELARLSWVVTGAMTTIRFALTLLYDLALIIDMFRLWGRDWFVLGMHELRLGDLCKPTETCFPISGATPWPSLSVLSLLLLLLLLESRQTPHSFTSKAN